MAFLFSPPDESLHDADVSGTVDADFQPDWLTDPRPSFPAKTTGNLSLDIATAMGSGSPAPAIGILSAFNHTVDAGTPVVITGDISASITPETWLRNGIPLNPYTLVDPPQAASALHVAVTGNSGPVVMKLWGGAVYELEWPLFIEPDWDPAEPFEWEAGMAPYDEGYDFRRLRGKTILSGVGWAAVEGWYLSTRRGTRPSLIVPDSVVNDAWLVVFRLTHQPMWLHPTDDAQSIHHVQFEFLELPRTRW